MKPGCRRINSSLGDWTVSALRKIASIKYRYIVFHEIENMVSESGDGS